MSFEFLAAQARKIEEISAGRRWRYLPHGTVVHALISGSDASAVCGISTLPASNWRGTGSQGEYEFAAQLPKCRRCLRSLWSD